MSFIIQVQKRNIQ